MVNDLQLDEEKDFSRRVEMTKPSVLVKLVLATGVVNTEKKAGNVLLAIAGACLLIAAVVSVVFLGGDGPPVNPYQEGQSVLGYPEANQPLK